MEGLGIILLAVPVALCKPQVRCCNAWLGMSCRKNRRLEHPSKTLKKKTMLGFEEQVGCHQVWKEQKVSRKAKESPLSPRHLLSTSTYDLRFIFQCSAKMLAQLGGIFCLPLMTVCMLGSWRDPAVSWILPGSVTWDTSLHGKRQTVHACGAKQN